MLNKRRQNGHFKNGCLMGGGLVFVLVLVVLAVVAFHKFGFLDVFLLSSDSLTPKDLTSVNVLIKNHKILSAGDIVSHITSFYSVVITILVGVLGLLGILGYIHIKTLAIEKLTEHKNTVTKNATETATEKVQQYLKTKEFSDTVDKSVSESLEGTDVDEINKKIARLENKIDEILSSPRTATVEVIPETPAVPVAVPVTRAPKAATVKKSERRK